MKSAHSSGRLTFGRAFRESGLKTRTALIISSWFGVGLVPRTPGTAGTAAALPAVLLVYAAGPLGGLLIIVLFVLIAVWGAGETERALRRPDPREVVSDEVAGFMVTMYLLPFTWPYLLAGFMLFRLFDIIKPFPIRSLERISGGTGIILDDLAAGVMANLVLHGAAALSKLV